MLITPKAEAAETTVQVVSVDDLITQAAQKYGINRDHLYKTLYRESAGFQDAAIQSNYPDVSGPNGKEDSWGFCQIHLPDHPDITKAEAVDPVFCIDWSAKEFAAGRADRWTEYRKLQAAGWPKVE